MSTNENLQKAMMARDDEFYTRVEDIMKELELHTDELKGKSVLCNCNDVGGGFHRFFADNFDRLGLRRLVCVGGGSNRAEAGLFRCLPARESARIVTLERTDGGAARESTRFIPDGDFRSAECASLMDSADIVCTNPPFSLFRVFISMLAARGKKFLVVGNMNAVIYKCVFPLIKEGKLWLGTHQVKKFTRPDGGVRTLNNVCWYTNLGRNIHHPLALVDSCGDEYPRYDNYDAVEVSNINNIPGGYNGVMGVPVSFMCHHCPAQFDVLGCSASKDPLLADPLGGPPKVCYKRIFIRRRVSD